MWTVLHCLMLPSLLKVWTMPSKTHFADSCVSALSIKLFYTSPLPFLAIEAGHHSWKHRSSHHPGGQDWTWAAIPILSQNPIHSQLKPLSINSFHISISHWSFPFFSFLFTMCRETILCPQNCITCFIRCFSCNVWWWIQGRYPQILASGGTAGFLKFFICYPVF